MCSSFLWLVACGLFKGGFKLLVYDTSRVLIPCAQLKGLTKLTFIDGTEIRVKGLDDIFAAARESGLPAGSETAELMLARLEQANYIPVSARREYQDVILKEYRIYLADRLKFDS